MRRQRGFTLLELMIVVAIVGILSMIALPSYNDYITRGKIQEATSQLSDLRVKMEQYYMDNRRYGVTVGGGGGCGIGAVPIAPPLVRYFAYSCASTGANAAGDQTYTITATGCAGPGAPVPCVTGEGMSGFVFTITEGNVKATVITAGSPAASAGWIGNAACWVQKKSGAC